MDPAIVYTTRHLLGGAMDVRNETWDDTQASLSATLTTVPGDPVTAYVALAGRTVQSASVAAGPGPVTDATHLSQDGLAAVTFTPTDASSLLVVQFE